MKLRVFVTPQKQVVHPPSQTVLKALHALGHSDTATLTFGKYLEVEVADDIPPEVARQQLEKLAVRADIFNPVTEDCRIEVGE